MTIVTRSIEARILAVTRIRLLSVGLAGSIDEYGDAMIDGRLHGAVAKSGGER